MRALSEGAGKANEAEVLLAKSLLKRGGRVYTVMIPNARSTTLLPIMERTIMPDSIVYTDAFRSYDALDVSDFHHVRINHSERFVDR